MPNPVSIGSMLAKPGDGTVNDQRVDLFNLLVPYPKTVGHPWSEFFDQHVRLFDELFGNSLSLLVFHVQRHAALVPIDQFEKSGKNRSCFGRTARPFHHGYLSPKVSQDTGAIGAGQSL